MEPVTPVSEMQDKRFGRFVVLGRDFSRLGGQAYWHCRCECGKVKSINGSSLRRGLSTSCGCARNEAIVEAIGTHGMCDSPEYSSWRSMLARCYGKNEKHTCYAKYAAKGISVCDRWRHSFENFIADMGPKPSLRHTIDRFPNRNGNYELGNCRWATPREQALNRKSTRFYTHDGITLCVKDWCIKLGLNRKTVTTRMTQGKKTIGQALGLES